MPNSPFRAAKRHIPQGSHARQPRARCRNKAEAMARGPGRSTSTAPPEGLNNVNYGTVTKV